MTHPRISPLTLGMTLTILSVGCGDDAVAPTTVNQAVNSFQNAVATGGFAATVDSKGPVVISAATEFPGFAFGTYDIDVSANSLSMRVVADPANLMITSYDNTTFDRYYFEFDETPRSVSLGGSSDPNFAATVEILAPGSAVMTSTSFVMGLPTSWTFDNGAIAITIGEGTDLTKVSEGGGTLSVDF